MIDIQYLTSNYMIKTLESIMGKGKVHAFEYENLFINNMISEDFMHNIFGYKINIVLEKKVNKKQEAENLWVGSTKPHWFEKDSFITAFKKGINAFLYSYSSVEDLQIKLEWNNESDKLFEELQYSPFVTKLLI
jgi:hypothetical protein